MDSGDWVTLIVSVVTIMVSVFGAHELARQQDKRKTTADLFATIYDNMSAFQDAYHKYLTIGYYHDGVCASEASLKVKDESAKEANDALAELGRLSGGHKANEFLLSLMVNPKDRKLIVDRSSALYEYAFQTATTWKDVPNKTKDLVRKNVFGFGKLSRELTDEMRNSYFRISRNDMFSEMT